MLIGSALHQIPQAWGGACGHISGNRVSVQNGPEGLADLGQGSMASIGTDLLFQVLNGLKRRDQLFAFAPINSGCPSLYQDLTRTDRRPGAGAIPPATRSLRDLNTAAT